MEKEKMSPADVLQAILKENETLKEENKAIRETFSQVLDLAKQMLVLLSPYCEEEYPQEPQATKLSPVFSRVIEELDLPMRPYRCLKDAHIKTVGDIVQKTEDELSGIKQFGRTSLRQVKKMLADLGLRLGMTAADMAAWTKEHEKDSRR